MYRVVAECRPAWVLAENVPALRTRGADRVLADLGALGYACVPLVVGAWAVGAPHRRDRVWIVAHAEDRILESNAAGASSGEGPSAGEVRGGRLREGLRPADDGRLADAGVDLSDSVLAGLEERRTLPGGARQEVAVPSSRDVPRWPAGPSEPQHEWEEPRLVQLGSRVDDAEGGRLGGSGEQIDDRAPDREVNASDDAGVPGVAHAEVCGRSGEGQRRKPEVARPATDGEVESRRPELAMGGAASRLSDGLVRLAKRCNREALRAYGNAVVPQVVEAIGRAIVEEERQVK